MAVRSDEFGYIEFDKPEDAIWLLQCALAATKESVRDRAEYENVGKALRVALFYLDAKQKGEAPLPGARRTPTTDEGD